MVPSTSRGVSRRTSSLLSLFPPAVVFKDYFLSGGEEHNTDILDLFAEYADEKLLHDVTTDDEAILVSHSSRTTEFSVKEADFQDIRYDMRRGPRRSRKTHVPKEGKYSRVTIRGTMIEECKAFSGLRIAEVPESRRFVD